MIGATLEYYDFALYNSMAALVFNKLFFPSFDPVVGTILAFSTYAVGYIARPIGSLIFGQLGDRKGRPLVLILAVGMMGLTSFLIGLLPTYASLGTAAPALLVFLRFLQGIALGGEWAGSALLSTEHGDPNRRGLNGSWTQMGPASGVLLATGVLAGLTLAMPGDEFVAWGWRIPFLLSVALAAFGLWVRLSIDETPVFRKMAAAAETSETPIGDVVRNYWRRLLIAGGVTFGTNILYALIAAFALTYITVVLHLSRAVALGAMLSGAAVEIAAVPIFGALSDRIGRRPVYGLGAIAGAAAAFLLFGLYDTKSTSMIVLAEVFGFLAHAAMHAPQASFITDQFPTRIRFTGSSLSYGVAAVLSGGFAPLIITSLFHHFGSTIWVSAYILVGLLITAISLLCAQETAGKPVAD